MPDDAPERPDAERLTAETHSQSDGQPDDRAESTLVDDTMDELDAGDGLDLDAMAERLVAELSDTTEMSASRGSQIPVSIDRLFALLSEPGNRFVLTYLLRADDPASSDDLVEYVVSRASPPDDVDAATYRGRVAARLVHATLPDLAAAGLVEHDPDDGSVSSTPAIDAVAPYLALAISQSRSGAERDRAAE